MLQTIIDTLYRHPKDNAKRIAKFGGYISYKRMMRSRKLMERSSLQLPPVNSYPDGLPLYFLTGKNYLYQTLFCIQSLSKCSNEKFKFTLVDDGSFDDPLIAQINKQISGATLISQAVIEQYLEKIIPQSNYPVLHHKRKEYPHLKKLTDIHTLPGADWKLVLDSDMLFWNEPTELIDWLKSPDKPLHMVDCTESYGYSRLLMEQLANTTVPKMLNVGAIGLKSNAISWDNLEKWIKELEVEGKSYYLEQALSAMLIGNKACMILNKDKYIVNPVDELIANSTGILHHYVDLSKKGYYNLAWRKVIQ